MILTQNFYKSEFDSKDGADMPVSVLENVKELAQNLQTLRDYLKAPITVNSGYRSPDHNKAIGGVKNSQHLYGKAADIVVEGRTPKQVATAIKYLIRNRKMKQGGIGVYSSFTHYDIRGTKARW